MQEEGVKSKSKTLRSMGASSKEKKRKGEKKTIKTILLNSIPVDTSEPYEENDVQSWMGETTHSVIKRVMTQKGVRQEKKLTKRNPAAGQKDHFKCIWPAKTN